MRQGVHKRSESQTRPSSSPPGTPARARSAQLPRLGKLHPETSPPLGRRAVAMATAPTPPQRGPRRSAARGGLGLRSQRLRDRGYRARRPGRRARGRMRSAERAPSPSARGVRAGPGRPHPSLCRRCRRPACPPECSGRSSPARRASASRPSPSSSRN